MQFFAILKNSWRFNPTDFKFGQCHLKTFTMKCQNLEFSLNAFAVVTWWTSMFCHETGCCCNLNVHCPICTKFLMLHKIPSLTTSPCEYWVIAPSTENWQSALHDKHHLIYMKFARCGLHLIYSNMMYYYGCSLAPLSGHRKGYLTCSWNVW